MPGIPKRDRKSSRVKRAESTQYTEADAIKYVRRLGTWQAGNPKEYRRILLKLIDANKTRKDQVGAWETRAAWAALDRLDKGLSHGECG